MADEDPRRVKRPRDGHDDDDDDEGVGAVVGMDGVMGQGGAGNLGNGRERRKIDIKFIQDKSRRHITFSKRKAGIMKKAYELSVLTGTQVLLLVVSETGLVYTFTTPKLQPLVTKPEGKNLIQSCLNAPEIANAAGPVEPGDSPEPDNMMHQRAPVGMPVPGGPPHSQHAPTHTHPGMVPGQTGAPQQPLAPPGYGMPTHDPSAYAGYAHYPPQGYVHDR